jgi:hypothetical protein
MLALVVLLGDAVEIISLIQTVMFSIAGIGRCWLNGTFW